MASNVPPITIFDSNIGNRLLVASDLVALLNGVDVTLGNITVTKTTTTTGNVTTLNATTGNITGLGIMPTFPLTTAAAAGTVQGNATALVAGVNFVTGADGTKGVILPAGATGNASAVVIVYNNGTAGPLKVYPPVGGVVNVLSGNSSISMANATSAIFASGNATQWRTLPVVPS